MSHPFGDLLTQYRARKHGLSQSKLAETVGYDHAIITRMCQGKKELTGPSGRERVVRIIGALHAFGALSTLDEANALLGAANVPPLYAGQPVEAALIQSLNGRDTSQYVSRLPIPPTTLIGREDDVASAKQHLMRDDVRLLTLIGPPGVGKTRLATQVANELSDSFPDGTFLVPLVPITDDQFILPAVAQALGVIEVANQPLSESVKRALRSRRVLLVLDNVEQLPNAAIIVADLLAVTPNLKVLVTSRAALRLSSEHEYQVPPLSVPDSLQSHSLDELMEIASVVLFIARAQAVQSGFALTEANAATIAAICRRLDGLPLAIELAAARIKLFPPLALLARLVDAPLDVLTNGVNDLPPRQRMLRSTIDWSYAMLSAEEQVSFRRLGVFVGGFTLEAAEAVAGARWSIISDLLDKSLIQCTHISSNGAQVGEGRFDLLEMLREYAAEKLAQCGEADQTWRRYIEYFVGLAEAAESKLLTGEQVAWLNRLSNEHDNLRAALRWAQDHGETGTTLRIIGALWRYWQTGNRVGEGRAWLYPALETEMLAPAYVLAKAYHAAGALALYQDDMLEGYRLHEQGAMWANVAGDEYLIGLTLNGLTSASRKAGDIARTESLLEQALAHNGKHKRSSNYAFTLMQKARMVELHGDHALTMSLDEEAKALFLDAGDKIWAIIPLLFLGTTAHSTDDDVQAQRYFTEGLLIAREVGAEFAEYGLVCSHLSGVGGLAATRRHPLRMARLYGAVESLAERVGDIGCVIIPAIDRRTAITQYTDTTDESVDEHAFKAAWAEGRAMTLEQAIDYALSDE